MIKYIVVPQGMKIKDSKNGDILKLSFGDVIGYDFKYEESEIITSDDTYYHFNISKYLINKIKKYGYEVENWNDLHC